MKRCTRCGEVKPLTEFCKDKSTKDGYGSKCKTCRGVKKPKSGWSICEHGLRPSYCKTCQRQYYLNHSNPTERIKIPCPHGNKKSECKICRRKQHFILYWKNRDKIRARYSEKHPPKMLICVECGRPFETYSSQQFICGSKKCKSSHRNKKDKEFRANVRSHYGTCCAVCGAITELEIDHKYGYGKEHRIEIGVKPHNSSAFYRWLRDNGYPKDYTVNGITYKDGFRVLCRKHNARQPKKGRTSYVYPSHTQSFWKNQYGSGVLAAV